MKRVKIALFPQQVVSGYVVSEYDVDIPLRDYRKIFTSTNDFNEDIIVAIFKYYVKNISSFDPIFSNDGFLLFLNLSASTRLFKGSSSEYYHELTNRWYEMDTTRKDNYPYRPFINDNELVELGIRNVLAPPVSLKDGVVSVKGYKKKAIDINREVDKQRRAYDRKMLMLGADSRARKSLKHAGATGKRKLIHKWQKQPQGRRR